MPAPTARTIREVEQQLVQLRELLGPSETRRLLKAFIEDSLPRLDSLEEAVGSSDGDAARAQAHSLKGAAGGLGAASLFSVCEALEREIQNQDWRAARQGLGELRERLGAVSDHFATAAD